MFLVIRQYIRLEASKFWHLELIGIRNLVLDL